MRNAKIMPTPIELNIKMSKEMCLRTEDGERGMEKMPYRELVGSLIYLANAMQSDIVFVASTLSCFCMNPGYEHWFIAKRVLRYLKSLRIMQ